MGCMKIKCNIILVRSRKLMSVCVVAMAVLMIPTFTSSIHCIAQGRKLSKFSDHTVIVNEERVVKMRSLIGSRPPRCKRKCNNNKKKNKSCGHCEAVQIPIMPQELDNNIYGKAIPRIAYSRGDDITNYKPMCWKCKCGDFIFNP